MSLSSLSSNDQIIEQQPLSQDPMFPSAAFPPPPDFLRVPPTAATPQITPNPLIPSLCPSATPTQMTTQPQLTIRPIHMAAATMAQRLSAFPQAMASVMAQPSMQAQTQFYNDQLSALSYWNQAAQRSYLPSAAEAASSYFPYSAYNTIACTNKPLPNYMPTSQVSIDSLYSCKQYSHTMLTPSHEEKRLHLSDARIANSPHFRTIE